MSEARPAATVVVLRAAAAGPPEVLMVRRARGQSFMADAFVFPGGRVDDADREAARLDRAYDDLAPYRFAAARELLEEAAVALAPSQLVPFARWVTPSAEPKRFDTCFFLAEVAPGTEARVDATEVTEHLWAPAAAILARHAHGELKLPPPTLRTLDELSAHETTRRVLAWASARPLSPIQPKLVADADGSLTIVLPWDRGYVAAAGEGAPIAPTSPLARGASRYVLREGRFWAV